MKIFEIGKTYTCEDGRVFKITDRTDKVVWFIDKADIVYKPKRVSVAVSKRTGDEYIKVDKSTHVGKVLFAGDEIVKGC